MRIPISRVRSSTVASIGCVFDRTDELLTRFQHAPGEEARQELAPGAAGPPPSRWTLRGVRASFPWLKDYTLSGVWRLLRRHNLRIRAARVRQHSPDPEYVAKVEHLLAVRQPDQIARDADVVPIGVPATPQDLAGQLVDGV